MKKILKMNNEIASFQELRVKGENVVTRHLKIFMCNVHLVSFPVAVS